MAAHGAVQIAAELDDPNAMVVVILPDGGRSYLSKVFSDTWMQQHGSPSVPVTCWSVKAAMMMQ